MEDCEGKKVLGWPPYCGGEGVLGLRLSWRLDGGLGRASGALLAPPSWN